MSINYKTPQQIADQYLLWLKTLKPEVNTSQTDSDWWVRAQVVGGVFSGIYADQKKISDDAFPQSARREALEKHLNLYFDEGFTDATQALGNVLVSGATGSIIPVSTQFQYEPNGNLYTATSTVNFGSAATASVPVLSVSTGQNQNLLEGAELSLPSPPAGVNPTAIVYGGNLSDGRDIETNEQASARILAQVRTPLAGGKVSDYEKFALDASTSVTSAKVIRFPFGFGTVAVVITAGTTDIDTAIDNGDPIILTPSAALVQAVQDYIETKNPTTDCAFVIAPAEISIDATVRVRFASGNASSILTGQTLTQEQLVQREVRRAIYKTPPGGRNLGGSGFVVASEIEEVLDLNLGADPYTLGNYAEILLDRQVDDLSASGANRMILANEVAVPGVITVIEM